MTGDLHGVPDFHLHLLFGRPVSVSDDGDDAAELHPEQSDSRLNRLLLSEHQLLSLARLRSPGASSLLRATRLFGLFPGASWSYWQLSRCQQGQTSLGGLLVQLSQVLGSASNILGSARLIRLKHLI